MLNSRITSPAIGSPSLHRLSRGTLVASVFAIGVCQLALAIPAVLNGLFQQDLAPSSSQLTWISAAFLVPLTLFELTFGVVGDLFGRKRLLVIGSLLLAAGMTVCMLTPGPHAATDTRVFVLWIGQILAGIGAAAMMPTTLAMIAAGTHTPRDRAHSISVWAAALATGSFVSPVLGGYLAQFAFGGDQYGSWRWAFLAVVVLSLASAVITLLFAKNSSAPEGRSLDWAGQAAIAVALFALLYAVVQGSTSGWGSADIIAGFVISAVFFALFIVVERRSKAPLLRLDLFRIRPFAIAAIATVFGMFAYLGTAYATSIRLSAIQGFSPLKTSIAFVLLDGMALVLTPVVSRAMQRFNPRWVMGFGFLLIGLGDLWMATLSARDHSLAPVVAPLLIVGIGFAFAISGVTGVAVNTVENHLAGMASGATSLLRDFGFTLGPVVIGSIALSTAAAQMQAKIAANPAVQKALAAFNGSAAHTPAAQRPAVESAIGAVNSGPLGANSVPSTITLPDGHTAVFNPIQGIAFDALDHAYSLGYVVCGCSALVAALLAILVIGGAARDTQLAPQSLDDAA